jgi:hypothetical protein
MTVGVSVHPRTRAVIAQAGVRELESGKLTRRFERAAGELAP